MLLIVVPLIGQESEEYSQANQDHFDRQLE
jgi:hypothetical protein